MGLSVFGVKIICHERRKNNYDVHLARGDKASRTFPENVERHKEYFDIAQCRCGSFEVLERRRVSLVRPVTHLFQNNFEKNSLSLAFSLSLGQRRGNMVFDHHFGIAVEDPFQYVWLRSTAFEKD